MKTHKNDEAVLQNVGFKLCSLDLIRLVRRNEELYNSEVDGYSDKSLKELTWEHIYSQLFPRYGSMTEDIKVLIRESVRRRWKTLRNAIAREVKRNAETQNYIRKSESRLISELEFLIPHIKSTHCAKLTEQLSLRDSYQFANKAAIIHCDNINEMDSDDCTVHSANDLDTKPNIAKAEEAHRTKQTDGEAVSKQLLTNRAKECGALAHNKDSAFANVMLTIAKSDDVAAHDNEEIIDIMSPVNKKRRTEPETAGDTATVTTGINTTCTNNDNSIKVGWNARVMKLLSIKRECNDIDHDEDRMFLMSLVSDLKRIPTAKRPAIKAEIVTVIARALD